MEKTTTKSGLHEVGPGLWPTISALPALVKLPFDQLTAFTTFPRIGTLLILLFTLGEDASRLVNLALIEHPKLRDRNRCPRADRKLRFHLTRDTVALQDALEDVNQRPIW